MRNIKLTLEYDGTRYKGWQKQGNTQNTVQETLSSALSSVCSEEIELIGSGRTDAGVHAYNQVANFKTSASMPVKLIKAAANEMLRDICIKDAVEADRRFHARYNAIGKKYVYRIWNNADINVFERKYSYHIPEPLDIKGMAESAELFIGTHDFRGFSSDKRTKKSTVKTVHSIDITPRNGMTEILFSGDSFLYNMVRIMTGTLIEIGLGNMPVSRINEVLDSKDRAAAGFTAPPQGLFLKDVLYS